MCARARRLSLSCLFYGQTDRRPGDEQTVFSYRTIKVRRQIILRQRRIDRIYTTVRPSESGAALKCAGQHGRQGLGKKIR